MDDADQLPELDGAGAGDDFAGPEFVPSGARQPAASADLTHALAGDENWSASRIRSLLQAQGALVHGALAVDKGTSQEWLYTSADLDAIAPPLARIMNRYPATRAAAAGGDELAVAIGFAGYAARSYSERRMALQLAGLRAELDQAQHHGAPEDAYVPAAAAPSPEPAPMQTADELEWPAEGEPPPITGLRR